MTNDEKVNPGAQDAPPASVSMVIPFDPADLQRLQRPLDGALPETPAAVRLRGVRTAGGHPYASPGPAYLVNRQQPVKLTTRHASIMQACGHRGQPRSTSNPVATQPIDGTTICQCLPGKMWVAARPKLLGWPDIDGFSSLLGVNPGAHTLRISVGNLEPRGQAP